jgi:Sigma-70 region 2
MARVASSMVGQQIGSLFEGGSVVGLSDRQLIDWFVSRRDAAGEAAFAALVARHGPMVLLVSRRVLGDHQPAEDIFQAVVFVLARRARTVRDPDLLSQWLYGVALRTAHKATTSPNQHAFVSHFPGSITTRNVRILYSSWKRTPSSISF